AVCRRVARFRLPELGAPIRRGAVARGGGRSPDCDGNLRHALTVHHLPRGGLSVLRASCRGGTTGGRSSCVNARVPAARLGSVGSKTARGRVRSSERGVR